MDRSVDVIHAEERRTVGWLRTQAHYERWQDSMQRSRGGKQHNTFRIYEGRCGKGTDSTQMKWEMTVRGKEPTTCSFAWRNNNFNLNLKKMGKGWKVRNMECHNFRDWLIDWYCHITLGKFKKYSMLTWYTYISRNDWHVVSANTPSPHMIPFVFCGETTDESFLNTAPWPFLST